MKTIFTVLMGLLPLLCDAQIMNGHDISQMTSIKYMEVVISKNPLKPTYFAKADIGQGLKVAEHGFQDTLGEDKEFKSVIHVLNWLGSFGWEYMDLWKEEIRGIVSPTEVTHVIMKRSDNKSN